MVNDKTQGQDAYAEAANFLPTYPSLGRGCVKKKQKRFYRHVERSRDIS
jgi:hypothetical protein